MESDRERMVQRQLERRGIRDSAVLAAMRRVPRHAFVPEDLQELAYDDRPLEIGEGQTISQPYVVALTIEELMLRGGGRVLDVGTGSGYAAAVLSEIADEVYSVERIPHLARAARERLARLGYHSVHIRVGDGAEGWLEHAPFDGITVAAAAPSVPTALRSQLAVGATLVLPVGEGEHQELLRITRRSESDFSTQSLGPVRFVPLVS